MPASSKRARTRARRSSYSGAAGGGVLTSGVGVVSISNRPPCRVNKKPGRAVPVPHGTRGYSPAQSPILLLDGLVRLGFLLFLILGTLVAHCGDSPFSPR